MENEKLFSILICTLAKRQKMFKILYSVLEVQAKCCGVENQIEILSVVDNGKMPVGKKRNILISMSKGKFIAFVDDDDRVNSNYIKIITNIIKTNPDIDCIGMTGIYTTDGKDPKKFIHTLNCKEYFEKDGIYYRCPNHLNPIRRDCIKDIKFDEINFGEDAKWAFKIRDKNLLKKEIMYDQDPLYYYRFSRSVTATQ